MNKVHVKLGIINRLVLGAKTVSLDTDGVLFDDELLKYPEPLLTIKYKPGIFIDRIIWGELKYSCIRNNDIRAVFSDLEKHRIQYWRPIYKEYYQDLLTTSEKFESYFLSFNKYIRESHKNDYLKRLSKQKCLWDLKNDYLKLGFDVGCINKSLLEFFSDPDLFVANKNELFVKTQLSSCRELFDNLEDHPLTENQREACIRDEDNVLVIAGAGTGKTSTMRAKAAYLVQQGFARPEEILMLSYGRDARRELEERVNELSYLNGVVIRTFHSIGKEIIGSYENKATDISVLASDDAQYVKFIDNQIEQMVTDPKIEHEVCSFFSEYLYPQPSDLEFKSKGEYLQHVKDNEIRDLDGNSVKSFEELKISNYLYKNGIKFEYEPAYLHPVSSPGRNVYHPDYYLPELDVYIEHFGIDENGNTRRGIDKNKYNQDREWKLKIHQEYNTNLIQTFSYESKQGLEQALEAKLKEYCLNNGIIFDSFLKPVPANQIFSKLKELGTYKNISKLIGNYLTLFKASPYDLDNLPAAGVTKYDKTRLRLFHIIFKWVYKRYCAVLSSNEKIDFSDMIRDAEKYIRSKDFHERTQSKFKYRYIMVDEFQDVSHVRAELVGALKEVGSDCALFCVGDDWQAIYRFTGSDVSMTTNYSEYFGKTYPVYLDKTFRFNNQIESVASGFVQLNPSQLKKDLSTHTTSDKTEVYVMPGARDESFIEIMGNIDNEAKSGTTVLVLSRFNESLKRVKQLRSHYPGLNIKYMSVHASKGKQADYVIILDVVDGQYGFPSKIMTDTLLESLLPKLETYAYAEERRLFYVAMTRAKKTVFIQTELGKESIFIKELKKNNFDVSFGMSELSQLFYDNAFCPECGAGTLLPRKSSYGLFYVCSLGKNYCGTKVTTCPTCQQAPLLRNEDYHYCANSECDFKAERCQICGTGRLLLRKNSKTGKEFLGCSNYKRNKLGSCTYRRSIKTERKYLRYDN